MMNYQSIENVVFDNSVENFVDLEENQDAKSKLKLIKVILIHCVKEVAVVVLHQTFENKT